MLDIGCGAGRHSLYLQSQGYAVTGIDLSPLAVQVCQKRGMQNAIVLPVTRVSKRLGTFDTFLMLGNNFALLGNPIRARWLLRRFYGMSSSQACLIAQTRDPYRTDLPEHLAYHARNQALGRLSGQASIRVRYKQYVTPWFEFMMLSPQELSGLVSGTGWTIPHTLDDGGGAYVALLMKNV